MQVQGDQKPVIQEEVIWRTKTQLELFHIEEVNDIVSRVSQSVACAPFRKFGLYVYIDSTSNPTTLQVEVEFLDRWTGAWYQYKQGLFAALFWEAADTASGIYEAFTGDVLGRALRIRLTGVGTEATKYFRVSAGVDFWN